jgi:hypothetical protein
VPFQKIQSEASKQGLNKRLQKEFNRDFIKLYPPAFFIDFILHEARPGNLKSIFIAHGSELYTSSLPWEQFSPTEAVRPISTVQ